MCSGWRSKPSLFLKSPSPSPVASPDAPTPPNGPSTPPGHPTAPPQAPNLAPNPPSSATNSTCCAAFQDLAQLPSRPDHLPAPGPSPAHETASCSSYRSSHSLLYDLTILLPLSGLSGAPTSLGEYQ